MTDTVTQFILGSRWITLCPTKNTFERLQASWRSVTTCWWSLLAPAGAQMSGPYGRLPWLFAIEQKSMVTLHSHWYGWCPVERRYMQLISGTSSMVTSSCKHWTSSLEQEGCLSQTGGEVVVTYSWQLANSPWYPLPATTVTVIQESTMARLLSNRDHKSVVERLEFGLGGQLPLSGWPHNLTTRFWPPSTTVVSPESLQHCAVYRVIAVPAERDGDKLTVTCVPVESRKRYPTLSIPVRWLKLAASLSKLHSMDDAVAWLTNYGSS